MVRLEAVMANGKFGKYTTLEMGVSGQGTCKISSAKILVAICGLIEDLGGDPADLVVESCDEGPENLVECIEWLNFDPQKAIAKLKTEAKAKTMTKPSKEQAIKLLLELLSD